MRCGNFTTALLVAGALSLVPLALADESPDSPPPSNSPASQGDPPPLADSLADSIGDIREPFRRIDAPKQAGEVGASADSQSRSVPKSPGSTPLVQFPSDSFRIVGIMTGPVKPKAVLMDPEGKTHFVSKGTKIGIHGGTVISLSSVSVRIREKIVNSSGKAQNSITEIRLPGPR